MDAPLNLLIAHYNYWSFVILMMVGLYAMIGKKNLIKKIIGMGIFQTAIILFYVSSAAKREATIPIVDFHHGERLPEVVASEFINPLPHVLMLTAIVVSVATLGVALSLAIRVFRQYGSLEEDAIMEKIGEHS